MSFLLRIHGMACFLVSSDSVKDDDSREGIRRKVELH